MEPWLYIVLLGLVLVVYAKLVPRKESGTKQTNVRKEIEDTMEQFSAELEEENRQLLGIVSEIKKEHDVHTAKLQGRIEALERHNREVGEQLNVLIQAGRERVRQDSKGGMNESEPAAIGAAAVNEASPANGVQAADAVQPEAQTRGPMNIRERYADIFQLYDQGKSTEYIAKKLEMNKGEVMLIIQLAKQEEQARV